MNLGALMIVEALTRRIAGIVSAHSNPTKPSWEQIKYFTGTPTVDDVAGPALRAHVARKVKEENENNTMSGRPQQRGAPADGGDDAAGGGRAGGGRGGGGRGMGRGRGRGVAPSPSPAP